MVRQPWACAWLLMPLLPGECRWLLCWWKPLKMTSYSLRSTFAPLPKTVRGLPIVLGGDPKGKTFLYVNGKNVIIRNIENHSECEIYSEHAGPTSVAQYSPSGYYIASGDSFGKIRIWDTTQKEHILKYAYQPISAEVKDIAWSPDSKRMAVVGNGREKFARVFLVDSGSSVGEIAGHSRTINSVDYKSTKPFRIITGSEDKEVGYFEGPPFKNRSMLREHSNFVNIVRFSPDGEKFATGGADTKVFVYDAKTGERTEELGKPAHKAGVYAMAFSPDSSQLLTVSGDKTARLWDLSTNALVSEFVMGKEITDMQVGCLWQGQHMLTVSLSGYINYLDRNNPSQPLKILKGHNKPITSLCLSADKSTLFTACSAGHILYWDAVTGDCDIVKGKGHTSQIQNMAVNESYLVSVGIDDVIHFTSLDSLEYGESGRPKITSITAFASYYFNLEWSGSLKLESQPRGLAVHKTFIFVACINHIIVLEGKHQIFSLKIDYESYCISIHPDGQHVAVGGQDKKLHIYEFNNNSLNEMKILQEGGEIRDASYSPDGTFLVTGNSNRMVTLYTTSDYKLKYESPFHSARVNSVAWTTDSLHIASGGIDGNIIIYDSKNLMKPFIIKCAHQSSQINRIAWLNDNLLVSVGQDSCIKEWDIVHSC